MFHDSPTARPVVPQINNMRLVRLLGSGGYGNVWLGQNITSHELVAVKLISLDPLDNDLADRELSALRLYQNQLGGRPESLLKVLNVDQNETFLYYFMELADDVSGGPASLEPEYQPATLSERINRQPIMIDDILRWSDQLLCALTFLHQLNFAHRDLKPANCMFFNGVLKLGDIGLMTKVDNDISIRGTLNYMPSDKIMDQRADVHAMGLVIYQMLTGLDTASYPLLGGRFAHLANDPRLGPLNKVINTACSKDRQARYANAGVMREALRQIPAKRPQKNRYFFIAGGLLAMTLMTGSAYFLRRQPITSPSSLTKVNMITRPFEAEIYIDGQKMVDTNGNALRTPCTIHNVTASEHHVEFRLSDRPKFDDGVVDFSKRQEININFDRP